MGFLDNLFGGQRTSADTTQTRTTKTTTTTNLGDIGLTGQGAIDLAAVLEAGGIAREQVGSSLITGILQSTGEGWNQLVGGASNLVQAAGTNIESLESRQAASLEKWLPWIVIGSIGAFIAFKVFK